MEVKELGSILKTNQEMMCLLKIIQELNLKDSWLCAGTIRNFIWNYLEGKMKLDRMTDIDIIFFDPLISYSNTLEIQTKLSEKYPEYDWEIKNQVFMHNHNPDTEPYKNSRDAISKFPEKCTAIGTRLFGDELELFCPYGIEEIVEFIVSPTPYFQKNEQRMMAYKKRVNGKNWSDKWPNLKIVVD